MGKGEKIERILKEFTALPSEKTLSTYLKEIRKAQKPFPREAELALCAGLLKSWDEDPEKKKVVLMPPVKERETLPHVYAFGILSLDWPGLSDSCIGVVRERGWNIRFLKGQVIDHGKKPLGIVLIAIEISSPQDLQRLKSERAEMAENLKRSSMGSLAKTFLLAHEARKRDIHDKVSAFIQKSYEGDELKELIGAEGEVVKFFASRSESYLEERKIEDLADVITTNYNFIRRVRSSGGKAQVRVKNLKTTREHLTGITVAGLARDFSLNDCLRAAKHAVPDFQRKYNKEFTTGDGITLYRIEITDQEEKPFKREDLQRIRRSLLKMAEGKMFERQRWIESTGGFEHYARAIIPFLLKEYEASGKTQVYLSVGQSSEYFIDFKIIIVTSKATPPERRLALRCAETLDGVAGLSVLSATPPKVYGGEELDIIDLRADLDHFADTKEVYSAIREKLKQMIGEFRDFDEGMRRMDVKKLEAVRSDLRWKVDEDTVRQFYYSLEDFYRIGAPIEEIVQLIRSGNKVLGKLMKEPDKVWVKAKNVALEGGPPISSIVAIAYTSRKKLFGSCLEALKEYDVTVNRVDRDRQTILICRLTQDGKPLPSPRLKEIVAKLEQVNTAVGPRSKPYT